MDTEIERDYLFARMRLAQTKRSGKVLLSVYSKDRAAILWVVVSSMYSMLSFLEVAIRSQEGSLLSPQVLIPAAVGVLAVVRAGVLRHGASSEVGNELSGLVKLAEAQSRTVEAYGELNQLGGDNK